MFVIFITIRETMIVFVYDTECLSAEGDDPASAVLYFHPNWVSNTQKLALCGQLMGTSYFLKDCLFKARVISLQNGKFILKEFGRFVLVLIINMVKLYFRQYNSRPHFFRPLVQIVRYLIIY